MFGLFRRGTKGRAWTDDDVRRDFPTGSPYDMSRCAMCRRMMTPKDPKAWVADACVGSGMQDSYQMTALTTARSSGKSCVCFSCLKALPDDPSLPLPPRRPSEPVMTHDYVVNGDDLRRIARKTPVMRLSGPDARARAQKAIDDEEGYILPSGTFMIASTIKGATDTWAEVEFAPKERLERTK